MKYLVFCLSLTMYSLANAFYLFAEKEIPVRSTWKKDSQQISTIKTGETFEVIKWNKHNTRIRLSDGRIGFIDKDFVDSYAPDNNNGYLVDPLKLTTTTRSSDMQRNYPQLDGIKLGKLPATGNAEDATGNDLDSVEDDPNDANDVVDYDQKTDGYKEAAKYSPTALVNKLSTQAWYQATRKRQRAQFLGGGYASGNRSKGMCAQAVKEALVASGICKNYPSGDARNLHTNGVLKRDCPALHLAKSASARNKLDINDISQAPAGSVIVYSGYAGTKPHNYGHIEIKVPVTPELKTKMGRDGLSVKVGQFVYCSDFCRATPTKKSTNSVIGIYTL